MKIKTLEYIHTHLIQDERVCKDVYDNAQRLLNEYREKRCGKELIARQAETVKACSREYNAALDALEDFEGQEW